MNLWKSFLPASKYDHPAQAGLELPETVMLGIGGSRVVKTHLTAAEARSLAEHLIRCAEAVEQGPAVKRINIQLGPPPENCLCSPEDQLG